MSSKPDQGVPPPSDVEVKAGREGRLDYLAFVESHEFGEHKKIAIDLAKLLNLADLEPKGESYEATSTAEVRQKVFDAFCSVCVQAGVEVPDLEPNLYLPFTPKDPSSPELQKKSLQLQEITTAVRTNLEKMTGESRARSEALLTFLQIFLAKFDPVQSYGGVSTREVLATLNKQLVEAGCEPIRPDYTKMDFKGARDEREPQTPVKVVTVDDSLKEAVNSAFAIVGWPNVTAELLIYQRKSGYGDMKEEERLVAFAKLAEEIFEANPNVVLMDQTLDQGLEGSELIAYLKKDPRAQNIRFVANTGGGDEKMAKEGAYPNFDKGKNFRGIRQAI